MSRTGTSQRAAITRKCSCLFPQVRSHTWILERPMMEGRSDGNGTILLSLLWSIFSNQAIYQSSSSKLTMYLKFESMYYVANHCGLLGHVSFAWETIRTRTLILPGSWCNLWAVHGHKISVLPFEQCAGNLLLLNLLPWDAEPRQQGPSRLCFPTEYLSPLGSDEMQCSAACHFL